MTEAGTEVRSSEFSKSFIIFIIYLYLIFLLLFKITFFVRFAFYYLTLSGPTYIYVKISLNNQYLVIFLYKHIQIFILLYKLKTLCLLWVYITCQDYYNNISTITNIVFKSLTFILK